MMQYELRIINIEENLCELTDIQNPESKKIIVKMDDLVQKIKFLALNRDKSFYSDYSPYSVIYHDPFNDVHIIIAENSFDDFLREFERNVALIEVNLCTLKSYQKAGYIQKRL